MQAAAHVPAQQRVRRCRKKPWENFLVAIIVAVENVAFHIPATCSGRIRKVTYDKCTRNKLIRTYLWDYLYLN